MSSGQEVVHVAAADFIFRSKGGDREWGLFHSLFGCNTICGSQDRFAMSQTFRVSTGRERRFMFRRLELRSRTGTDSLSKGIRKTDVLLVVVTASKTVKNSV